MKRKKGKLQCYSAVFVHGRKASFIRCLHMYWFWFKKNMTTMKGLYLRKRRINGIGNEVLLVLEGDIE